MIKKLKRKFIRLSMTSLFVLLFVIVAGMNLINYNSVVSEADDILSVLSQNKGTFPDTDKSLTDIPNSLKNTRHDEIEFKFPHNMSPETPFESRYFSVLFTSSGNLIQVETSRIAAVDTTTAIKYAKTVLTQNKTKGFLNKYRFICYTEENTIRITFLDCGRKIDSFSNFLLASCGMSLAGFIIVFFVFVFFAGRIIRPISESYEKQKQFITDAGHEIKTPLTIINANIDILEMDFGKNESFDDIRQQTNRLTTLTNDLVYLARMEESENKMPMIIFPISDVMYEIASSFKILAQTQNKKLQCDIQPMLSMNGNDKSIAQLISILLDNALKYSPENSIIHLHLRKQNRLLNLSVCNITKTSISENNKKELSRVFDRFYRLDTSRNSETGGHGIGLSIAKAIVLAHDGKIQANTPKENEFQISIIFHAVKE